MERHTVDSGEGKGQLRQDEDAPTACSETERILAGLDPEQQAAVTTTEGPVLVVAGPGSGKTRVLTHRVAYLIATGRACPDQILAVTFTNKAAREVKERLQGLLGTGSAELVAAGTFHSICARVLRRYGGRLGLDPAFTIYDEDDQLALVKQALKELGLDP
ncbi:MAG: UvrD-helicase domain-containing protein, partial [Thermomicrobium sp.]